MGDFAIGSLAMFLVDFVRDNREQEYEDDHEEISYLPVDYYEYIKSPQWKSVADEARKRAGYKCQMDGATGKLSVHHNNYKNLGNEKDTDLIVLCRKCHAKFHDILLEPPNVRSTEITF